MPGADLKNQLFFGDSLAVLREHIADESAVLVYLDPPFNSNANYNVLFKEVDGAPSVRIPALRLSGGRLALTRRTSALHST